MSQLLRIHLVNQNPRVLHGRRADRRLPHADTPLGSREGPLWCEGDGGDPLAAAPTIGRREIRKEG
jgi:hypothetical protein